MLVAVLVALVADAELVEVRLQRLLAGDAEVLAHAFEEEFDIAQLLDDVGYVEVLVVDREALDLIEQLTALAGDADGHVQQVGLLRRHLLDDQVALLLELPDHVAVNQFIHWCSPLELARLTGGPVRQLHQSWRASTSAPLGAGISILRANS
jgi:hypothetical protein